MRKMQLSPQIGRLRRHRSQATIDARGSGDVTDDRDCQFWLFVVGTRKNLHITSAGTGKFVCSAWRKSRVTCGRDRPERRGFACSRSVFSLNRPPRASACRRRTRGEKLRFLFSGIRIALFRTVQGLFAEPGVQGASCDVTPHLSVRCEDRKAKNVIFALLTPPVGGAPPAGLRLWECFPWRNAFDYRSYR